MKPEHYQHGLANDLHRPRYHFLPPGNWMNDPNGLIQWKDEYHLFYQYNPNGAFHGSIHWGHAVSRDLIHWEHLPIGLAPTPGGPDEEGCWSGCAVNADGIPTLIYTAIHPQTVCLATGSDDLVTWQKHRQNPVLDGPPGEISDQTEGDFRDPFVWRSGEHWLMVIGTKIEGQGGMILLYESNDLINWNYLHPLVKGDVKATDPFWTGTMWECPNLIDFGAKQVLIISAQATSAELMYAFYYMGEFRQDRFQVERQEILVPTQYFYAPQIMKLNDGRIILWGWVREGRSDQACIEAGWSGMLSLPLECCLSENGKLGLAPAAELRNLRKNHHQIKNLELNRQMTSIKAQAFEILAQFEFEPGAVFGLKLGCTPDGGEIRITFHDQIVFIDSEWLSLSGDLNRDVTRMPVEVDTLVNLRVFLDHSIIELFVNDESYLVSRIYPASCDNLKLTAFGEGQVNLVSIDVWEMESIW
jgi:beta-fructofuranosidase